MPTPFGTYIHVCTVTVLPQYHLRLKFDDDSEQTISLEPYLLGPLWSALRDERAFAQVSVNPDTGTIEWPNGADLNPVILHDWAEVGERIIAEGRARYIVDASAEAPA